MQQKTTLMLLLIIGLISSICFTSCKKDVDKVYYVQFKYVNATQKSIKISDFRDGKLKTGQLDSGNTLIAKVDLDIGASIDVFALTYSDSILLTFDNNIEKWWFRDNTSNRNPLLLDNYEVIIEKDKEDVYLFTFEESDFD